MPGLGLLVPLAIPLLGRGRDVGVKNGVFERLAYVDIEPSQALVCVVPHIWHGEDGGLSKILASMRNAVELMRSRAFWRTAADLLRSSHSLLLA